MNPEWGTGVKHPSWFGAWDRVVNRVIAHFGPESAVVPDGFVAIDTHVHSFHSKCSVAVPEQLIITAVTRGLSGIAVMDHNNIEGARHTAACAQALKDDGVIPGDFIVIPGIEVNTRSGHVGGLFIDENIERGLTPEQAVRRVHEAGGIAVAAHPFHSSGVGEALFDLEFDAVEIESGMVVHRGTVERSLEVASDERLRGLAKLGASDAHYVAAVGSCYTLVETDEVTPEAIKAAILGGKSSPRASGLCGRLRNLLGGIPQLK